MDKKIIIGICIIFLSALFIIFKIVKLKQDNNFKETTITNDLNDESETDNSMENITSINITINNKTYIAKLEGNKTVDEFIKLLPQDFNMSELNGNEKYVYMDYSLPTNSYSPKHIEVGDIMLYGSNCLVVFYKSFDTSYSYTKIGHIDNLDNIGNSSIVAKFEK